MALREPPDTRDPRLPPDLELLGAVRNDPVELASHDPAWPAQFTRYRDQLCLALGPAARRIEHIGSTALEGQFIVETLDLAEVWAREVSWSLDR
jgi:GrpB-like predicted nucleotidyltransferase (UPF0157 family)